MNVTLSATNVLTSKVSQFRMNRKTKTQFVTIDNNGYEVRFNRTTGKQVGYAIPSFPMVLTNESLHHGNKEHEEKLIDDSIPTLSVGPLALCVGDVLISATNTRATINKVFTRLGEDTVHVSAMCNGIPIDFEFNWKEQINISLF